MTPSKIKFTILLSIAFFVGPVFRAAAFGADQPVVLKYTYKTDQSPVTFLHDMKGKAYLPLMEVAQFYGVQAQFDSQTRRVFLEKGKNKVKLVLSQPVFMVTDPEMSVPIEPVEVISGQLGIPPQSAEDVFGALLDIQVNYSPDQQSLTAGGVREHELRQEIMAQAHPMNNSSAVPTANTAVGVTQVSPTAVPTFIPTPEPEDRDDEQAQPLPPPGKAEENEPSEKQVYRVRRIIIDPGHGGKDSGAKGYDGMYCEKQATLDIAQRMVDILRKDPSLQVYMTRTADYFITLKYRTEFANRHQGDLFVSIHCNANPHSKTTGTETYVYSARPSNKLAAVAAVSENGYNQDFSNLLADLHQRTFTRRSQTLAEEVESRIRDRLHQHLRYILHAPFYVLRQVDMPSILVETAFITNPKEEKKLEDPEWREKVAKSIADGILSFRDIVESTSENQQARR